MSGENNSSGFVKVDESIAINKDNDALSIYRKRRMKEAKLDRLSDDVENMKKDIREIMQLLKGLTK